MCPFSDTPNPWFAILPTVLGGVIAGLVGIWVSGWQRRRDARNQFLVTMSLAKSAIPQDSFVDFHRRSLSEVKEAVYRVLPFLGKSRADRLFEEWKSYLEINEGQLLDRYDDECDRIVMSMRKERLPPKPSDLLKDYIDRLSQIVK